jgi:aryl sulfotransferase
MQSDNTRSAGKTQDVVNWAMDTRLWEEFEIRDDDVIITTYAKAGTTWGQQIAAQLIFNGDDGVKTSDLSPWLELRVDNKEEKFALLAEQTHRRFYKSHAPANSFVIAPQAKYVYICRDGRDVVWSMYNMHGNFKPAFYDAVNAPPGPYGPQFAPVQGTVVEYFRHWLTHDGAPWWSFWDNVRSWWAVREYPNVLLVHFADLKSDLGGEIERIAEFLGFDCAALDMPNIVQHCTFAYMKREAERMTPMGGKNLEGGAEGFVFKGTNGRWRELLDDEDCARYVATAEAELGAQCAAWVAAGRHA